VWNLSCKSEAKTGCVIKSYAGARVGGRAQAGKFELKERSKTGCVLKSNAGARVGRRAQAGTNSLVNLEGSALKSSSWENPEGYTSRTGKVIFPSAI